MLETFRQSGFPLHSKIDDESVEIDFSVAPSEESTSHSELRDRVFTTASLHPVFQPRSVAVIGASRDPASLGYRILDALVFRRLPRFDLRGESERDARPLRRRPIPPRASSRRGSIWPSWPSRVTAVLPAVDDCAVAGVRALVVVTAGFARGRRRRGALSQQKLVERVREAMGMRIVGPNSMGLVNTDPDVRLNASVSTGRAAARERRDVVPERRLGLAMLALARQRHVGISTFVSVGNKADISGNDLLQYWQGDEATRVILLYLESFGNPRRFARIAQEREPFEADRGGEGGGRAPGGPSGPRFPRRASPGGCALPPDGRHPGRDAGRDVRPRRRARSAAAAGGTPRRDPLGRRRPRRPLRGRLSRRRGCRCLRSRMRPGSAWRPFSRPGRRSAIPWSSCFSSSDGPVRPVPRDASPRRRGGRGDRDPHPLDARRVGPDARGDPAGRRRRARGGSRRQAGPGLPGGQGGRRRADRSSRARASRRMRSRSPPRGCSER